jgi:YVTN family beta-propeller protein
MPAERLAKYHGAPVLAVSRTDKNKITFFALESEERELGTISVGCKGPFGLAFADERKWLYAACWDHSKIVLVDLRNDRKPQVFQGAKLPAWIQSRDSADEIWISNEAAGTVTVYRCGSSTVMKTIPTSAGPSDILFTDQGRTAWVSNETAGNVSMIDAEHYQKIRDIPVGKVPQGMALTNKKDRLLVANFGSNTISVIETVGGRQIAQIPVREGPIDLATATQGESELVYVSCYKSGAIAIIDLQQQKEIQRIPIGQKPFGVVAHPYGGRIYVCAGGANQLLVIETGKPSRILRRIPLDGNPLQIAVSP